MARNKKKFIKKIAKQQKSGVADERESRKPATSSTGKKSFWKNFQSGRSWIIDASIFSFLLFATLILYSGSLHLGFFSIDDSGYVTKNPWIRSFSSTNLGHILTVPYFANFSPAHLFSYMIDYALAGPDPYVFHLSSNIWAGIVAGFVYLLAFTLLRNRWVALAAGLLFVVHPSHVEAIAWISSRKDLVAAAFALPCFMAYIKYREKNDSSRWRWYGLSLFLFLFAIGGKMSVATIPAVFFAYDLFVGKRKWIRSLIDQVSFLLIGVLFALAVASAQPPTGNEPEPFVYMASLTQSLWLMTGFGSYVLQREPFAPASMALDILGVVIMIAVFLSPLLLRRRYPLTVVLIYWILFTYLPSQVLSFVHPVADRYFFLPSVAVAILIAWGIFYLVKKYLKKTLMISFSAVLIIALIWGGGTVNYLREWQDPRSVWYAAVNKSQDTDVYYGLGEHYMTEAARMGTIQRGEPMTTEQKIRLASKLWKSDPRLPKLIEELNRIRGGGPLETELQNKLWDLTEEAFNKAFEKKGTRVMPHLYLRMGVMYLDRGDLERAKQEFLQTIDEVSRYSVSDVGHELIAVSYSNLGIVARKQGDFRQALKWYQLSEQKQNEIGIFWVPEVINQRKELEEMVKLMPGENQGTIQGVDATVAYNLGLYYLNAANRLGTAAGASLLPLEDSKRLAEDLWKENPQLPGLLAEWATTQRGGPFEIQFQDFLKRLAWDLFEKSRNAKGDAVNSNLFFRRGMLLGDWGDYNAARNEFNAALQEAEREAELNVQHQVIVTSYDALGILAWREKKYQEALKWIGVAKEKQQSFGGNWISDLDSKSRQLESLIKNPGN